METRVPNQGFVQSVDSSGDSCSIDSENVNPVMPKQHQVVPYIVGGTGSQRRLPKPAPRGGSQSGQAGFLNRLQEPANQPAPKTDSKCWNRDSAPEAGYPAPEAAPQTRLRNQPSRVQEDCINAPIRRLLRPVNLIQDPVFRITDTSASLKLFTCSLPIWPHPLNWLSSRWVKLTWRTVKFT